MEECKHEWSGSSGGYICIKCKKMALTVPQDRTSQIHAGMVNGINKEKL